MFDTRVQLRKRQSIYSARANRTRRAPCPARRRRPRPPLARRRRRRPREGPTVIRHALHVLFRLSLLSISFLRPLTTISRLSLHSLATSSKKKHNPLSKQLWKASCAEAMTSGEQLVRMVKRHRLANRAAPNFTPPAVVDPIPVGTTAVVPNDPIASAASVFSEPTLSFCAIFSDGVDRFSAVFGCCGSTTHHHDDFLGSARWSLPNHDHYLHFLKYDDVGDLHQLIYDDVRFSAPHYLRKSRPRLSPPSLTHGLVFLVCSNRRLRFPQPLSVLPHSIRQ